MGPQYQNLKLDEMLQVMAWVRHLYKDDVSHAPWFTEAQKRNYKPYAHGETFPDNPPGRCAEAAGKSAVTSMTAFTREQNGRK